MQLIRRPISNAVFFADQERSHPVIAEYELSLTADGLRALKKILMIASDAAYAFKDDHEATLILNYSEYLQTILNHNEENKHD